jgi:hypothetical protein
MTKDDKVWISICSTHIKTKNYDCPMCKTGHWVSQTELNKEHELFTNNYPEWFKQHNNGKEPNESALEIWRSITGKE